MSNHKARTILNAVLLLVAGGLIAFIWFGPASKPAATDTMLSGLDAGTVSRVRIERTGRPAIELRRSGARWHMQLPYLRPADAARVAALLGLSKARVHEAFRAIGNDLSAFGLEPPVARVWFDDAEFVFGDTEPLDGWRYVLFGDDVHLITDAYFHHILATPPAFVDPAPLAEVTQAITVSVAPSVQALVTTTSNLANSPNHNRVQEALASAWRSATASAVRAFDATLDWRDGLDIETKTDGSKLRFSVADTGHELVFARPDWDLQYHFPRAAGERLLRVNSSDEG